MNMETTYRGVFVEKDYKMTSQNPGEGHSATSVVAVVAKKSEVLAYQNNAVVHRITEVLGCDTGRAEQVFSDLKLFLWMAACSHDAVIPSPVIDEAWHCFVLFTKDYADFCHTFFGEFLHHVPHRHGDPLIGPGGLHPTIDVMHKLLGGKPSANWDYMSVPSWRTAA